MKIKGKEVVEIRPMTREEYRAKHNIIECDSLCCFCQYHSDKLNRFECCTVDIETRIRYGAKFCNNIPAKANGKWQMLVRCKK